MKVKTILMPLFVLALTMISQIGFAQIYFVNHAATGANNGANWTDAYTDLQSALGIATAGTEIWVAKGTYYPTTCSPCSAGDRNISFEIPDGVKLFGGFDGTESAQADRNWVANLTVLSGDINQDGAPTENSYSVVYSFRVSLSTIVDGFTIRDGCSDLVSGAGRTAEGGGWYNDGSAGNASSPMVRNVRFVFNKAKRGGGMFNAGGFAGEASPIYQHVEFINNSSSGDGGGCVNDGNFDGESSPQFYSCQFIDNTSNGAGAGMFNNGAGIKDTLGNILYSGNSNPFITNCVFKNNTGFTSNGIGGAMYNLGSQGGSCTPSIFNTLFVENKAYAAACMYNHGGNEGLSSPSIINCTFANNEADPFNIGGGTGGAVYNNASYNGTSAPTVINCIFWDNIGAVGSEVFRNVDGTPFIAYCLVDKPDCASINSASGIGTTACGLGMLYNQNPNFVDPSSCDYRLQDNSPAINVGDNQVNGSAIDLDSLPRIINSIIDLGPYESESVVLPIDILSFNAKFDGAAEVDLFWSAINDKENGLFEIERSQDGINFEIIARKEAANDLNVPVTYHIVDEAPLKGKSYYRLKVTEYTGHSYYSQLDDVTIFDATIIAYPNPVTEKLNLSINEANLSGNLEYYVHSISGKEMLHKTISAENEISIGTSQLDPGMHSIIIFLNGNKLLTHRFIVTKL